MKIWLLSILFLGSFVLNVQAEPNRFTVTESLLVEDRFYDFSCQEYWFYKQGDDTAWADPQTSLDGWEPIDLRLGSNSLPPSWSGNAWFKSHLAVDSTMFGKRITLSALPNGAMEVYLNGVKVGSSGKVGHDKSTETAFRHFQPIGIELGHSEHQQLTIRYSNYHSKPLWFKGNSGIHIAISNERRAIEGYANRLTRNEDNNFLVSLTVGIFTILGLLHLVIFFFYPKDRLNLALGIYMLLGAFSRLVLYWYEISETPGYFYTYVFYENIAVIPLSVVGVIIAYMIIGRKPDWFLVPVILSGVGLGVFSFFNPLDVRAFVFGFFLITIFVILGLFLYARIRNHRKDVNILLFTVGIYLLLFIPQGIWLMTGQSVLWSGNMLIVNFATIIIPVGFSIYVAKTIAQTNSSLRKQLHKNEKLNAEKIEAEREKKQILNRQKAELEVQVAKRTEDLEQSLENLKSAQDQLIQQEKLASLGQLTAGIAHEIKNPLNFVNNFSELSIEMVEEAREEVLRAIAIPATAKRQTAEGKSEGPSSKVSDLSENLNTPNHDIILEILDDIEANLRKIHEHGSRADGIVKSMLMHSRGGSGKMEPTNLNAVLKEYVNLSFHGMRAGTNPINVDIDLQLDDSIGNVDLITEDFSRVIVNLCNNAFDAMRDKVTGDGGPKTGNSYLPKLTVRTKSDGNTIAIEFEDNGPGISQDIKDKILQPFFTTKKGTEGTGLGLSITNDIIKAHRGELKIHSEEGKYSKFKIILTK